MPLSSNKTLWLVAAVLGVYWLALIYELGAQWTIYEEYNYGWAVPFLCVYLIWKRGAQAADYETTDYRTTRGGTAGQRTTDYWTLSRGPVVSWSRGPVVSGLVVLSLAYAPTRFLHEANPIWRLTSWLWALEVVGLTLCLLRLALPGRRVERGRQEQDYETTDYGTTRRRDDETTRGRDCGTADYETTDYGTTGLGKEDGGRRVGGITYHASRITFQDLIFPVCFFLVAVPWPTGWETLLVQSFTRLNVSATVEVLGWLGIPALQHGNVIEVATGQVSVDPACSGIRSFQVVLMMGLFFGEFYRLPAMRRVFCILAGFAFSALFNLARTTVLTCVQAKKGRAVMASWHDPVGVSILVACFTLLWLTAVWLRERRRTEDGRRRADYGTTDYGTTGRQISELRPSTLNPQPSTLFRLALALLLWFALVEAGTQFWFHLREHTAAARESWSLDVTRANPALTPIKIPADISSQFRADESLEAQGRDGGGNAWQLYYFRWLPSQSLSRRVAVQLAKVHGPEICLPAIGMTMQSDLGVVMVPVGRSTFALHEYIFQAGEQPLHVFYAIYEDPTGTAVLANRRQDSASRVAAALAGSRNDGQRFLEIAISGPQNAAAAQAAVRAGLEKLVRTE